MPWNIASNLFAQAATLCNVFSTPVRTRILNAIKSDWILIKWGRWMEIKWNKGALESLWAQPAVKCNCQSGNSQDDAISTSPIKIRCLRPFCQDDMGSKRVSTAEPPSTASWELVAAYVKRRPMAAPQIRKETFLKRKVIFQPSFGSGYFCVLNGHCPFGSEVSWVHSIWPLNKNQIMWNGKFPAQPSKAYHLLGSEFLQAQGESAVQTLASPNKIIDDSKCSGNKGHINYSTTVYISCIHLYICGICSNPWWTCLRSLRFFNYWKIQKHIHILQNIHMQNT